MRVKPFIFTDLTKPNYLKGINKMEKLVNVGLDEVLGNRYKNFVRMERMLNDVLAIAQEIIEDDPGASFDGLYNDLTDILVQVERKADRLEKYAAWSQTGRIKHVTNKEVL